MVQPNEVIIAPGPASNFDFEGNLSDEVRNGITNVWAIGVVAALKTSLLTTPQEYPQLLEQVRQECEGNPELFLSIVSKINQ